MDIGTYAAASLGIVQMRKLEIQNNNLANVNTVGFKRQILVTSPEDFNDTFAKEMAAHDPYAQGDQKRVASVNEVSTHIDFSMGAIKRTGNPLDVALRNDKDFFVVNTPQGRMFTRAGNFTLDAMAGQSSPREQARRLVLMELCAQARISSGAYRLFGSRIPRGLRRQRALGSRLRVAHNQRQLRGSWSPHLLRCQTYQQ